MDHQAFAQLLGNYGEFFGAIAVVVTLLYLAGQLKQNTNALRSASYSHWNEVGNSWAQFYGRYAAELSEIEKFTSIEQLSPAQDKLLQAEAYMATSQAETAFLQHRAGPLDHDVFEARMKQYTNFVTDNPNPMLRQVWLAMAKDAMIPEFAAFIEERFPVLNEGANSR